MELKYKNCYHTYYFINKINLKFYAYYGHYLPVGTKENKSIGIYFWPLQRFHINIPLGIKIPF